MVEDSNKVNINIAKGPKVFSDIWLEDKDFEIKNGEIKELPEDYKERSAIMQCIKDGRLKILTEPESKDKNSTLDQKDLGNFLNQNTKTVIKQLRINDLSNTDLSKLAIAEKKGKKRKDILKFIETLKEVS